ncbi:hypothetical protein TKK_0015796 [Trichogramma kaykai]|uniref:Uncharacterized protein n=1 Tax=Trichogramma kaykai TaxID=54128 RepID=A0ABD2W7X9_9HYME
MAWTNRLFVVVGVILVGSVLGAEPQPWNSNSIVTPSLAPIIVSNNAFTYAELKPADESHHDAKLYSKIVDYYGGEEGQATAAATDCDYVAMLTGDEFLINTNIKLTSSPKFHVMTWFAASMSQRNVSLRLAVIERRSPQCSSISLSVPFEGDFAHRFESFNSSAVALHDDTFDVLVPCQRTQLCRISYDPVSKSLGESRPFLEEALQFDPDDCLLISLTSHARSHGYFFIARRGNVYNLAYVNDAETVSKKIELPKDALLATSTADGLLGLCYATDESNRFFRCLQVDKNLNGLSDVTLNFDNAYVRNIAMVNDRKAGSFKVVARSATADFHSIEVDANDVGSVEKIESVDCENVTNVDLLQSDDGIFLRNSCNKPNPVLDVIVNVLQTTAAAVESANTMLKTLSVTLLLLHVCRSAEVPKAASDSYMGLENFSLLSSDRPTFLTFRLSEDPKYKLEAIIERWAGSGDGSKKTCYVPMLVEQEKSRIVQLNSMLDSQWEILRMVRRFQDPMKNQLDMYIVNMADCTWKKWEMLKGLEYSKNGISYINIRPGRKDWFDIIFLNAEKECGGSFACKRTYNLLEGKLGEPMKFMLWNQRKEWELYFPESLDAKDEMFFVMGKDENAKTQLISTNARGELIKSINADFSPADVSLTSFRYTRNSAAAGNFGRCGIFENDPQRIMCTQWDKNLELRFSSSFRLNYEPDSFEIRNCPMGGFALMTLRGRDFELYKFAGDTKDGGEKLMSSWRDDSCAFKKRPRFMFFEEMGKKCAFWTCDMLREDNKGYDWTMKSKCFEL